MTAAEGGRFWIESINYNSLEVLVSLLKQAVQWTI